VVMQRYAPVELSLADEMAGPVVAADWISRLFLLGRAVSRWSLRHIDSQLVVALSVPTRAYAAVLVGTGWMTATAPPKIQGVREVLADLPIGAAVRVVSQNRVFTERFLGVDSAQDRVHLGSKWQVEKLQAVVALPALSDPHSQPLPKPGAISRLTGLDRDWIARLCSPPQDLALIGSVSRLHEDLGALLGRDNASEPIENILLPWGPRTATWSTRVYSTSQLDDEIPLNDTRLVVLDGAPASRYLRAIESPVIVSVLDRSLSDESVPEDAINYRNTGGQPVSLERELHWTPPAGVEAIAFEVSL